MTLQAPTDPAEWLPALVTDKWALAIDSLAERGMEA